MKKVIAASLFLLGGAAMAAPQFVNGSLNTSLVNSAAAPTWINAAPDSWFPGGVSVPNVFDASPDIQDIDNPAGYPSGNDVEYIVAPSASPDGGTWTGLVNGVATVPLADFAEQISQSVSGFEVGKKYKISWYQSNFGLEFKGQPLADQDMSILVSVDGTTIGEGAKRDVKEGWEQQSLEFAATKTTHEIAFGSAAHPAGPASKQALSYGNIDGIKIEEVPPPALSPTPVPTLSQWSLALLIAMIGGAAVWRKRFTAS